MYLKSVKYEAFFSIIATYYYFSQIFKIYNSKKKYLGILRKWKYFYSTVLIVSTFQMPIVLAFTVKHHKNKINQVVPRQLQFHEENEENFNNDENTFVTPFTRKLHFHEDFDTYTA